MAGGRKYGVLCAFHSQLLFEKILEYEKSGGDEERVKQKAIEYADNTLAWDIFVADDNVI